VAQRVEAVDFRPLSKCFFVCGYYLFDRCYHGAFRIQVKMVQSGDIELRGVKSRFARRLFDDVVGNSFHFVSHVVHDGDVSVLANWV
jgi:hypothetical protein